MTDSEEYIDISEGTGSSSAQADQNERLQPRSIGNEDKHLGFNPNDGGQKYQELAETYRNQFTPQKPRREAKRARDALTFADVVECTPAQKQRVGYVLERLDFHDFGSPRFEKILLAMIAIVWRENGLAIDNCHLIDEDDEDAQRLHARFVDLCNNCDTRTEEIRRIRKNMKPHVDTIT